MAPMTTIHTTLSAAYDDPTRPASRHHPRVHDEATIAGSRDATAGRVHGRCRARKELSIAKCRSKASTHS